MTNYTNVGSRALLVTLNVSVWIAQRFDKDVSDEVADAKGAERHSGRYNKHLFGTRRAGRLIAPEFFAAIDAGDTLRKIHNRETLPWSREGGERLLTTKNYFEYMKLIRAAGREFETAVADFVRAYPRLILEAKPRLGEIFDVDDFIDVDEVKQHFAWSISLARVPAGGDVRIDLPPEVVATIERDIESSVEARVREAMLDAWQRLREAVARIAKASREEGIIRDNLIEHAKEVCSVIARLNVAESAELDEMRERVERELTDLAVEDLRKDEKLRKDTESRANDIIAQMSAFYEPQKEVA